MTLYRVDITVRLETYAHTEADAIRQVRQAIRPDTKIAVPEPGTPFVRAAVVTINPDRQ
jgi:hypothetical protein